MKGTQTIRVFTFLACAAGIAVGVWYVRSGGWWENDQDAASDEESDEPTPEGVGYRRGTRKTPPGRKKKTGEARQAPGGAITHGGSAPGGPSGPSYESAIAGNNLILAPGTKDVPDLTDGQLAGPMRAGTFLDACGAPSSMKVTVKVAIRNGRAVGVSEIGRAHV